MIAPQDGTRYSVRLSVPRNGGWRAWGAVSGDFEVTNYGVRPS